MTHSNKTQENSPDWPDASHGEIKTSSPTSPVFPRPGDEANFGDGPYENPEAFGKTPEPVLTVDMETSPRLDEKIKRSVLRDAAARRSLRVKRRDLPGAEKFFAANPLWSVGDLLGLMERCGKLGKPERTFDDLWHAKQGGDFKFLLRNLAKVLKELDQMREYPEVQVLPKDDLYAPRRRKVRSVKFHV